jgi:hypothetical protein
MCRVEFEAVQEQQAAHEVRLCRGGGVPSI